MSKHGYEKVSVDDIRQELRDYGLKDSAFQDHDEKPLNKTALVELLIEEKAGDDAEELLNMAEEETSSEPLNVEPETGIDFYADELSEDKMRDEEKELPPLFGEEGWSEYVMRQFADDELEKGSPKCVALGRVVGQLIGPVVSRLITSNIGPDKDNLGTATIVKRITVKVNNPGHPLFGELLVEEEIGDCNIRNTDAPFHQYPSATASTRAEARAYRKLLGLQGVVAAEEISKVAEEEDAGWSGNSPIAEQQINVMDMLCKRLNMSVMEFVNSGKMNYLYIEQIPGDSAVSMIQHLNQIQQTAKKKPSGVSSYDAEWRVENANKLDKALN